ncbi:MAG: bifunctional (p)ppGpp synthetase/guanosine-3',5'-bis(diphosphate) 3'-pyrophosphohydrolase [Fimbriimonadales bacterium]|nr:bifunctional (p)ppGpp synthetase/guanosine-3',5'-bis(diphosphate) 3'-pyrophosphohydrolase [Fimbriimonadales bacterium]
MIATQLEIPTGWEEPEGLTELLQRIREYAPKSDVSRIRLGYYVAETAHAGQVRQSGEPYITHPLAVAIILADMQMDEDVIIAALLHDVLEDTQVKPEQVKVTFGEQVFDLVEGVTKLKFQPLEQIEERKKAAEQRARFAETMRKMLMAMAADIRVMVIKLADRLHNMQTLDALHEDKRRRMAHETLDVYAPLAARLGIWQMKWQLEDLAFKHLHPKEFEEVSEMVAKTRKKREEELDQAIVLLKERLESAGFQHAEVQGRPKHLYSVYQKMAVFGFDFEEIYDLLGIRIILDTESDCYKVLGIVHELWKPIPGLFYDYIAKPKSNGYQSLHTKVVGPNGEPLEVQIRTFEMHRTAEFGIAAHWHYKRNQPGGKISVEEQAKINSLRQQIVDWSNEASTGSEFLRSVSTDLFSEQVFCFTPKGDVVDLPRGATAIDFAFRIHTEVGLKTVGAKVNGRIVKLEHELENGDIVEVMTRNNAQPSVDWLRIVKTVGARQKIRGWLRQQNKESNAQRGKEAIERELKSLGYEAKSFMTEERLSVAAAALKRADSRALLASVGEGLLSVERVVNVLTNEERKQKRKGKGPTIQPPMQGITIAPTGIDDVSYKRSKCCLPVPGDETVGYVSKGRGVILHRKLCPNAARLMETDPARILPVNWPPNAKGAFSVMLRIQTLNRQGLLADISAVFSETKTSVISANIKTLPNQTALLDMMVEVQDLSHLQNVIGRISSMQDVISIQRTFGGKSIT